MKILSILVFISISLHSFSQQLERFNMQCIKDARIDPDRFIEGIRTIEYSKNIILTIELIEDCSFDSNFIGFVNLRNDSLYIEYEQAPQYNEDSTLKYSLYSFCDCLFEIYLEVSDLNNTPKYFFVNNRSFYLKAERYKTWPIEYELTTNGDTINYRDKYGYFQGVHILDLNKIEERNIFSGKITHCERLIKDNKVIVNKVFWSDKNGTEHFQFIWSDYLDLTGNEKDSLLNSIDLWKSPFKKNSVVFHK